MHNDFFLTQMVHKSRQEIYTTLNLNVLITEIKCSIIKSFLLAHFSFKKFLVYNK